MVAGRLSDFVLSSFAGARDVAVDCASACDAPMVDKAKKRQNVAIL